MCRYFILTPFRSLAGLEGQEADDRARTAFIFSPFRAVEGSA